MRGGGDLLGCCLGLRGGRLGGAFGLIGNERGLKGIDLGLRQLECLRCQHHYLLELLWMLMGDMMKEDLKNLKEYLRSRRRRHWK